MTPQEQHPLAARQDEWTPPSEERARKHFEVATKDHQMAVLRDDGLYRHLRFEAPLTRIYGYDIVTWPGHLAINGDLDSGYTFARVADMIHFFNTPDINPGYWAEKITNRAALAATKRYDQDAPFDPYTDDERPWDWDHQYLICCYAIHAGVKRYLALRAIVPA